MGTVHRTRRSVNNRFDKAISGLPRALIGAVGLCLWALALLAAPASAQAQSAASKSALTPQQRCDAAPLSPERYSPQEIAAWRNICLYGFANLSANDDAGCEPLSDAEWPQRRDISQLFLDTILFEEPYRSARARPSIQITCARFPSVINFAYREIEPALLIDNSRLEEGISLFNVRARRLISLRGDRINGEINGDRLEIADNFFTRDGTRVTGRVNLTGAKIGGNIEAGGAVYMDDFALNDATVEGAVFINNNAVIRKDLGLIGAIIRRSVDVAGITIDGKFNADSIRVEGSVFLNQGGQFNGETILRASRIGSGVEAGGSTFVGEFTLDRAEVGGAFVVRGSTFEGRVLLLSARVGSNGLFGGATFNGRAVFDGARFADTLYLRNGVAFNGETSLSHGQIGGNLIMTGATFEGPLVAEGLRVDRSIKMGADTAILGGASFASARIADSLQLGGARLGGEIDLENASVGNALSLSDPSHGDPVWMPDSRISLRNTKVGAIRAKPDAWIREDGEHLASDLVGFSYQRESALRSSDVASMLSAEAPTLVEWIESQRGIDGAAHDAAYNPQPYEQLQDALIRDGRLDKALAIKYARYEHYRRAATTPELRRYGMTVLKYLAGYGVYPAIALIWFAALVVVGFLAAYFSPGLAGRSGTERFWYSFDNALPLLELSEHNKLVRHERGWVTSLFALQRVFGLVLATALIGAVSIL